MNRRRFLSQQIAIAVGLAVPRLPTLAMGREPDITASTYGWWRSEGPITVDLMVSVAELMAEMRKTPDLMVVDQEIYRVFQEIWAGSENENPR